MAQDSNTRISPSSMAGVEPVGLASRNSASSWRRAKSKGRISSSRPISSNIQSMRCARIGVVRREELELPPFGPRMGLDMAQDRSPARALRLHLPENLILLVPGFLVSVVVAVAARFLSDHYGAPAMLMALLLGIAFHFLAEEGRCVPGIAVSAKGVLRFGVALLGIRVSVELMASLGFGVICLVAAGVVLTILFGMLGARLLRRGWRFALLTGGAVAICGASAAMAIAAVLPKNEHSERNLIFTVLGVTVLSTIAMIVYPVISSVAGLGPLATGVFLGGTIHDVAQVVGAGFSISDVTGETATLVKLFRVTLLAPVVLSFSLAIRASRV